MFSYSFKIYHHCYSILKLFIIFFIDGSFCCSRFSNQENRYMIHLDSDFFYEIYDTINEHNQRLTHYLPLIPSCFGIYFWVNQKFFYKFICFTIIYDFYVITFSVITRFWSLSIEEINLIAIVSWTFIVSHCLISFTMSF